MRRALLTAFLLAPSLALAQVVIVETGDKPDEVVNIAECRGDSGADSDLAFQWTLSATFNQVELRISDTTGCPVSGTDNNVTAHTSSLGTFPPSRTTFTLATTEAMSRIGIASADCGTGSNVTVQVCVIPQNVAGGSSGAAISGTFLLDRAKPATPRVPIVTPGDGALEVDWDAVSGSRITYRAEARPTGSPAGTPPVRSEEVNDTDARLDGLVIGTQYDVVVIAISEGGNESDPSPVATGTPVVVNDFWRLYRNAGGGEEGGCSTTGGVSLALLAFAPFALRRRRS